MPANDTEPSSFGLRKMRPRDPAEVFRAASPLELFFDLIFVVAVSLSSAQLHHAESAAGGGTGIGTYLMVFFAIWWAWVNFTWFASAFDTDDWLYRLLTLTQMAGVIVLAVGTGPAMTAGDFRLTILGYVIMRLALVAHWLRASRSHPAYRRTALRYTVGIAIVQLGWLAFPFLPEHGTTAIFLVLMIAELSVPVWAESAKQTPWHPDHIADRYGCFTLIVLGESVLASTTAVASSLEEATHLAELAVIGLGGFVLAAGMWWVYFSTDVNRRLGTLRSALFFGYGHYVVFASAGAFSAGISVLLDLETGASRQQTIAASATLTVPVGLFVFGVWMLILRHRLSGLAGVLIPAGALVLAGCAFLPGAILAAALVMIALVVLVECSGVRREGAESR